MTSRVLGRPGPPGSLGIDLSPAHTAGPPDRSVLSSLRSDRRDGAGGDSLGRPAAALRARAAACTRSGKPRVSPRWGGALAVLTTAYTRKGKSTTRRARRLFLLVLFLGGCTMILMNPPHPKCAGSLCRRRWNLPIPAPTRAAARMGAVLLAYDPHQYTFTAQVKNVVGPACRRAAGRRGHADDRHRHRFRRNRSRWAFSPKSMNFCWRIGKRALWTQRGIAVVLVGMVLLAGDGEGVRVLRFGLGREAHHRIYLDRKWPRFARWPK